MRFRFPVLFFYLSLLSMAVYLATSWAGGYLGFPLDDAWIHQTYARNLGAAGGFAFVPGQPSAGSTAPLWSGLIAIGYMLRLEPRAWTYLLGWMCLALAAWLTYRLALQLWPSRAAAALLAGAFVALEWHMVWAAASGMETVLFTALALAAFVIPVEQALWLGVVTGVSVLVRPDGLTLLPFVLARVVLARPRDQRAWLACGSGFGVMFIPYLLFNAWLSGSIWPNTFYAKQAEYAIMRELPLWSRLLARCDADGGCEAGSGLQPFIGAQMLLLPGLAALVWNSARRREWERIIPLAWAMAFVGAYVLRLPVTYQHGRYLMPVIPALVALGVGGVSEIVRWSSPGLWPRVLSRAAVISIAALGVAFWGLGATAYQRDVQIIETEMVATARWISAETAPDALIAAHDIGALGYFGGRRILDLAGLISPEVIPFIRDEPRLQTWLEASGADYLMTLAGWYPRIEGALASTVVFRTQAPYSPAQGGANMVVYRWPRP